MDQAGAYRLKHYGNGDNDPVVVSHGGGHPCLWVRRLTPVWRRRVCGWVWAGAHARPRSCNDNDDVIVIASVVGDGRGPMWDPVGVPG